MEAIATGNSGPGNHVNTDLRIRGIGSGTRNRAREWIEPISITLAGLVGVLAMIIALGPLIGWNTVQLVTGSMAPELPTNSLLLTHDVPASEVSVGDIVMIRRSGELPITHRVVSNVPVAGASREIVLKGDANPTTDARPYRVDRVGVVVLWVPWGGQLISVMRSPIVLGLLVLGAASAVLVASWPRRRTRGEE